MERPRPHREKPARQRHKPPILGHFSYAGRTLSRSHPPSGRAGRTFSHTGHSHVATVKPPSPLRPLMQANVKPPSPMQPKNASKTPISHPQRRRRFHARDFQCPRAIAGPGRATGGRPTLQTSSNQRDSNRLTRTPVTNVVNPSPKTTIFSEKAIGLTTFVTTDQKSTRKTPRIDDVCNNTHQATRRSASTAGVKDAGRSSAPGHGADGRRRGLAGLFTAT